MHLINKTIVFAHHDNYLNQSISYVNIIQTFTTFLVDNIYFNNPVIINRHRVRGTLDLHH